METLCLSIYRNFRGGNATERAGAEDRPWMHSAILKPVRKTRAMDLTSSFTYTANCAPQVSGSGQYVAYVTGHQLVVRSCSTLATKRIISLPGEFARRVLIIRWDKCITDSSEQRLAVATADEVRTFSIDNGGSVERIEDTGKDGAIILPGKEEVANVEWWSCRYSPDEGNCNTDSQIVRLAVFSRAALKTSIWSSDGLELEIASPKIASTLKGCNRGFSVLTRPYSSDIVQSLRLESLAISREKKLVRSLTLHGCLDVKDAKWSRTGAWLATIDTPAMGYRVSVWGADGTLVHTYHGVNQDLVEDGALGAQTIEWIEKDDKEYLLIGDMQEQIVVLDALTYQPTAVIKHGSMVKTDEVPIWMEDASSTHGLLYRAIGNPFYPQRLLKEYGMDLVEVSTDHSLLATQVASMPYTVFVWSLDGQNTSLLTCITHSSPINVLSWNPDSTSLLILPTDGGIIGVWNRNSSSPPILKELSVASPDFGNLHSAEWISPTRFIFYDSRSFAVGELSEDCPQFPSREGSPALLQDDDTKVREMVNGVQQSEWAQDPEVIGMEDTFHQLSVKSN